MNAPLRPNPASPASLEEMVRSVTTRDDFVQFARAMHNKLADNPDAWENSTLPLFLDGLASWTDDMDGYFKNIGEGVPQQPSWRLFAQILIAATVYE